MQVTPHELFDRALGMVADNPTLQQEFIASHADPTIFDNHTFLSHTPHANQYLFFDAVLAMGLASCKTPGMFTGPELFEKILNHLIFPDYFAFYQDK